MNIKKNQIDFEMANVTIKDADKSSISSIKPSTLKIVATSILRCLGLFTCLFCFIVALDLMSSGFRLVAGTEVTSFLSSPYVLDNPVTGLMIGVIVTVLVQSSSTSTSIIVSMVGAGVMKVDQAIPVIMGANIGTSITSTLVSLGQVVSYRILLMSYLRN